VLASAYCIPLIPIDTGDLVLADLDLEHFLQVDLVVESGLVV
jgi:hypothetical protein